MYIVGKTFDDILRRVLDKFLKIKSQIKPTRGEAAEFTGVLLKLTNPRSRLSRTEKKGTIFSCLGELLWYLSGSNRLDFIDYYIPKYKEFSDDGVTIYGGYGPRLFNKDGENQIQNVLNRLRENPDTRRAVIQLFDAKDVISKAKDIPCTCTLQFFLRDKRLDMMTSMRSNDVFWGLPHDVFAFTMLQEIMARSLNADLGNYYHAVGSLHLYEKSRTGAKQFVDEGWQTMKSMPKMPVGDPWNAIEILLQVEQDIRSNKDIDLEILNLDFFWKDLIRILQVFSCSKKNQNTEISTIKNEMTTRIYHPYIEKKEAKKSNANLQGTGEIV